MLPDIINIDQVRRSVEDMLDKMPALLKGGLHLPMIRDIVGYSTETSELSFRSDYRGGTDLNEDLVTLLVMCRDFEGGKRIFLLDMFKESGPDRCNGLRPDKGKKRLPDEIPWFISELYLALGD